MKLSVIIVNWNSAAYIRECLASLVIHCSREQVEVIVVDSGSFDGCGAMLTAEFPWVRFIQSRLNIGFARANNLGAAHAHGRHFLFLNPDTLLLADSLEVLRHRLDTLPHAGAAGCRLLNADRSVQGSCVQSFPTVINQFLDSQYLRDRFPRSRLWGTAALASGGTDPFEVEAVSGACLAVKRDVFRQVGGFTESYFMYGEDLDLCYKVRTAGWKVFHLPESSVVHLGGGSSQQVPSEASVVRMRAAVQHFLRLRRGGGSATAYRLAMGAAAFGRLGLLSLDRVRRPVSPPPAWRKWAAILRWSLGHTSLLTPARGGLARSSGRN